ncbi:MAG: hypothetical protein WC412_07355 [Candidatus Omnitrophota bacterium]|jgi:hypothetical protein
MDTKNYNIKIDIDENIFHKFPFNFEKNIRYLLAVVPTEHITQLNSVKVVSSFSGKQQNAAYGFYYGKREGADMPSIIICADNIFRRLPRFIFYLMPFVPRLFLADTLYHEIAHHYQRLTHGIKKENWEKNAETYSKHMKKRAFRGYKWVLFVLFGPFLFFKKFFAKNK